MNEESSSSFCVNFIKRALGWARLLSCLGPTFISRERTTKRKKKPIEKESKSVWSGRNGSKALKVPASLKHLSPSLFSPKSGFEQSN